MTWLSRLVTFVLVAAMFAGVALLVRAALPNQAVGGTFHTFALMRDGSRLAVGSPVMIAGVRVGEVEKLTVDGAFARVDLKLRDDVDVPLDSWITKRATSAFGDMYMEIIVPDEDGSLPVTRLTDGKQLTRVMEGGSTDSVLRAIGHAVPRADAALTSVHEFLTNGRHWVDTAMRDRAGDAETWIANGKIEASLADADRAMQRFETGSTNAADAIAAAKPKVEHGLESADEAIASTREKIASVKSGLHDGLERARTGLDRIDQPIADYKEYVAAIDEGRGDDFKGKLGRLINDDQLGGDIDAAASDLRGAADNLNRFKTFLGLRYEFGVFAKVPRIYVSAEIRARGDKFYLFELERDSLGDLPNDALSDEAGTGTFTRTVSIKDQLRLTAQFGKQFGWLSLRGGMKDSTAGVGADATLLGGRLKLSADAFGGFSDNPRFKLAAAFAVFRTMYILGGIDDPFSTPGTLSIDQDKSAVPDEFQKIRYGRDYFLGASVHLNDDDLVTLFRVYGAALASRL